MTLKTCTAILAIFSAHIIAGFLSSRVLIDYQRFSIAIHPLVHPFLDI